jgi:hypothetical protein
MRDPERYGLAAHERAALRDIDCRLGAEDPELCRTFATAFEVTASWRHPWRWPPKIWVWLGAAFLAPGIWLQVGSSVTFGLAGAGVRPTACTPAPYLTARTRAATDQTAV